ncbi:phage tail tape measure protein [Szabonella alba]|uniref:Phage tail tape measure protein domain-containing protein n=1 Tax=Szabonella alba TaxID=2804194 RepID=A0A8K0VBP6_9RHOB|nr:phage tail tape measure protein [Szabonella alba]MBL4918968.1 hypothetical protein [Szabonella alba]
MNAAVGADERLVVMLEARVSEFEKRMARAEGRGTRSYQNLRRGSRGATQQMERDMLRSTSRINQALATTSTKIGTFSKTFASGFIRGGILGAVGTVTVGGLAQMVRGIAQVGDEAKRAGVSLEAFQEWKFVAEQNRIGVDQMVDGLKELNLRADEFVTTGKGSAAEAFQRLGFSSTELAEALKDPSELLLQIIGRLQGLDRAAQIRVADEIFGGSAGERFVELIGQGEAGLRRTIDRAHEVGAVMDSEMVQRAAELDQKWNEVTARVGGFFKALVVGAAEATGIVSDLKRQLDALPLNFSGAANDTVNSLQAIAQELDRLRAGEVAAEVLDLARSIQQARDDLDYGTISLEEFDARLEDAKDESERLRGELESTGQAEFSGVIARLGALWGAVNAVADEAARLRSELPVDWEMAGSDGSQIGWNDDPNAPRTRPQRPDVDSRGDWENAGQSASGGGGGRKTDDYAAAVASIREETRALEAQSLALIAVAQGGRDYGDAVEYARRRAELMHAAMKQGKQITPELTAEIEALAMGYDSAAMAAQNAAEQMQKVQDNAERGAQALSDIFMSVLNGSKSAGQALADLLMQMAKVQMQKGMMALADSGGAIGGFFKTIGGLLGFDGGGYTGNAPRSGGLDGKGGFLAMMHPRETVIDHTKRQNVTGGASQPLDVQVHVTAAFDESGNLYVKNVARQEAQQASSRMGAEIDKALPVRVQQINGNPRMR